MSKKNEIDILVDEIKKNYGKEVIMMLDQKSPLDQSSVIPTGSLKLDIATGIMGIPKGRIIEIFGPESSGKTTLSLMIIASAQKLGLKCAFIDMEQSFNSKHATALGVTNELLFIQPTCGEEAFGIAHDLVNSAKIDLIVIDSVAALITKNELLGEMGDVHMGTQAKMMGQGLKKIIGIANKNNVAVIFINQVRQKIGTFFGPSETTPGGNALKFFASLRIVLSVAGAIKENQNGNPVVIGQIVRAKILKNKLARPAVMTTFDLIYDTGVNKYSELIDVCVDIGIIQRNGSWFSYGTQKLGQGKESVMKILLADENLYNILLKEVLQKKNNIITNISPSEEAEIEE